MSCADAAVDAVPSPRQSAPPVPNVQVGGEAPAAKVDVVAIASDVETIVPLSVIEEAEGAAALPALISAFAVRAAVEA